jgi:Bacterial protein of unknown function (DUF937)
MSLFEQILGAINNPNQQASPDQLGNILGTLQQVSSGQGIDPATTQTVISMLGNQVRTALQQQQANGGTVQAEALVNQFGGNQANPGALNALFGPGQQQQIADTIAQRTGLRSEQVLALLPMLVPIVLNFLRQGQQTSGAPGAPTGGNTVLNSFLDTDGDGDVDLGDAMSMAGRFMNQR